MREKRKINGKLILGDVRSGMTDRELQVKYRLSANGLCMIFEKLVARQAVNHNELCKKSALYTARVCHKQERGCPRSLLTNPSQWRSSFRVVLLVSVP